MKTMTRTIVLTCLLTGIAAGTAHAETLTLRDCLKEATAGNRSLKVAAHDEKIAGEAVGIARSGNLPRIDFQGGYTAQLEPQSIEIQPGHPFATQDTDFGFFSLSLSQTLYDFGRTDARIKKAGAQQQAAHFAYAGREQETFLQVVQAYYGILMAQRLVTASQEETGQMTDHLKVAGNLYEQGVVTRNDVLQAEVRLATARQSLLADKNRLDNSWLLLNDLAGLPDNQRSELEDQQQFELPAEPSELDRSLAERNEVKSLRQVAEADEQEIREARTSWWPELFAKLGVDYVQNSKVTEQAIMGATVGLKVNLFDGLASSSRLRQSVASRSRTEARLNELTAALRLEYRTALNDARTARERLELTQTAIRQGEENLRINRDRYREQVGTATEVVDAQTLLTQARTLHYRALYEYQVAVARVKKSLGIL